MSEVIPAEETERARDAALAALRNGNLVVVPTDTVYAVVADAFQPLATRRVFEIKRRTRHLPLPVAVRSPRQVTGLVETVPEAAERLMASYWPGPLTLVLPAAEGMTWDLGESRGTVQLRMPAADLLTELIAEIGPLVCTGANRTGLAVPRTVEEAREQLDDGVALYIDGGPLPGDVSTMVDVTREGAIVLRAGAIPIPHVLQVAGGEVGWGRRPDVRDDGADSPAKTIGHEDED